MGTVSADLCSFSSTAAQLPAGPYNTGGTYTLRTDPLKLWRGEGVPLHAARRAACTHRKIRTLGARSSEKMVPPGFASDRTVFWALVSVADKFLSAAKFSMTSCQCHSSKGTTRIERHAPQAAPARDRPSTSSPALFLRAFISLR